MSDAFVPAGTAADGDVPDFTWEGSRSRWRSAEPDVDLTWGIEVTGDAFIEKVSSYGGVGPEAAVLEVGPGYGRLLGAALGKPVAFARWLGVDLSADNVKHLQGRFRQSNVRFCRDDVETLSLESPVDCDFVAHLQASVSQL